MPAFGGVTCGGFFNTAKAPTFSVADANLTTVVATLDGVTFASGSSVSAEGAHTLTVTATDGAGHVTMQSCSFVLDFTAPTISFNAPTPADGTVKNANFSIDASATDANLADNPNGLYVESAPGVSGLTDGDAAASHLFLTFPTLSLADGGYTVTLRAKDKAGNTSAPAARTFVVDRTAPVFGISTMPALASGAWTNAATLTISVAVTEANRAIASENVSASGCTGPSGTSPYAFTCTTEGQKTVSASGQDAAGNAATPAGATYFVDRTAPSIAAEMTPPAYARGSFTVSALVDDNFDPGGVKLIHLAA